MMKNNDLPLSFIMNLAQNENALKQFEAKTKAEKDEIISKTQNIKSRDEMKNFINSLNEQKD